MSKATLIFEPTGLARCLYTETIDLRSLGILRIRRASNVEFDNHEQRWKVYDLKGKCLYSAPSRIACLSWERDFLDGDSETWKPAG